MQLGFTEAASLESIRTTSLVLSMLDIGARQSSQSQLCTAPCAQRTDIDCDSKWHNFYTGNELAVIDRT